MKLHTWLLIAIGLCLPWASQGVAEPVSAAAYSPAGDSASPRYAVAATEVTWFDAARGRSIPATLYHPTEKTGPFPVILFSPGLGRSRDDCAYLGHQWASRGYVSVHVQHKGSDEEVRRGAVRPKKQLREAFDDPKNIRNRPRDIVFAIDQLERMRREGTPLGSRLDLDRIGVAGHDFGAQTALAIAGQVLPGQIAFVEPRVKAVLAMSSPVPLGQVPLAVAYGDVKLPCLHVTGTADNSIVASTQASQRRLPFDYTAGVDQYLVTLQGADHMTYSGHLRPSRNGRDDARFQRLIALSSTAFWDAYLKGNAEAKSWLAGDGLRTLLGAAGTVEKKLGR